MKVERLIMQEHYGRLIFLPCLPLEVTSATSGSPILGSRLLIVVIQKVIITCLLTSEKPFAYRYQTVSLVKAKICYHA